MSGKELRSARSVKGWTQNQVGQKLGVSQPYLSLLEQGKRRLSGKLARKVANLYGLSSATLPVKPNQKQVRSADPLSLAKDLAALGYPGYSYLRGGHRRNPAETLLSALATEDLETRLTEALPWVLLTYPNLDWEWLVHGVKERGLQNRLGFLTNFARLVAERQHDANKVKLLRKREDELRPFVLFQEQTLCHNSLPKAERRWLETNRPDEAKNWRVLTDLSPNHVSYA